jgi:hypothetical protein
MARFLLSENQRILWDTLQKIPVFQQYRQSEKEGLFSRTMESVYLQNCGKELSLSELQHLNRRTIVMIVEHIHNAKNQPSAYSGDSYHDNTVVSTFSEKNLVSKEHFAEQKQGDLQRRFDERQQEYSTMLKKDPPKSIDFRESDKIDEPIENMEELIRLQMLNRQLEIPTTSSTSNTMLRIHEPISLDNSPILLEESQSISTVKRHVSWDLSKNEIEWIEPRINDIQELRDEVLFIKAHLKDLNAKMDALLNK